MILSLSAGFLQKSKYSAKGSGALTHCFVLPFCEQTGEVHIGYGVHRRKR